MDRIAFLRQESMMTMHTSEYNRNYNRRQIVCRITWLSSNSYVPNVGSEIPIVTFLHSLLKLSMNQAVGSSLKK